MPDKALDLQVAAIRCNDVREVLALYNHKPAGHASHLGPQGSATVCVYE